MRLKSFVVAGVVGVSMSMGCGSSEEEKPAVPEGTPNKQGASSAAQTTITAAVAALQPSTGTTSPGQASATQLSSAAQATQSLVSPAAPSSGGTATKSLPLSLSDLIKPLGNPAGTTGTCECTADSCKFVACATGSLTIDGSYSFGGGKLKTSDLKYTVKVASGMANADVVINVTADMTVTDTSINGTFHSIGKTTTGAAGQSYSSEWDSSLEFRSVTFPQGGGKPTAGSLAVKATSTTSAGGQSMAYGSSFDITFPN